MKKGILLLTALLSLGMSAPAASQDHHRKQQTEALVDSTTQEAIEAYSDTLTAKEDTVQVKKHKNFSVNNDNGLTFDFDMDDVMGMAFVIVILLIIFVFSPLTIIITLFYFFNKREKNKLELARMAMHNGQAVPEEMLLEDKKNNVTDEYQKGLRQCYVGIGLGILLWVMIGTVGLGVGALIFFVGFGRVRAAKKDTNQEDNNVDNL